MVDSDKRMAEKGKRENLAGGRQYITMALTGSSSDPHKALEQITYVPSSIPPPLLPYPWSWSPSGYADVCPKCTAPPYPQSSPVL